MVGTGSVVPPPATTEGGPSGGAGAVGLSILLEALLELGWGSDRGLGMAATDSSPNSRNLLRSLSHDGMGLLLLGATLVSMTPAVAGGQGCVCSPSGDRLGRMRELAVQGKHVQPSTGKTIRVDESHNGQVVVAHPGDRIEIRLRSASGTPFSWDAGQVSGSSVVPDGQPKDEFEEPHLPGSPSTRLVPLRADSVGDTTLRFDLKSRSNPTASPIRTFTVTIRVISNREQQGKP